MKDLFYLILAFIIKIKLAFKYDAQYLVTNVTHNKVYNYQIIYYCS